jgi:hypothetical protein
MLALLAKNFSRRESGDCRRFPEHGAARRTAEMMRVLDNHLALHRMTHHADA